MYIHVYNIMYYICIIKMYKDVIFSFLHVFISHTEHPIPDLFSLPLFH